MVTSSNKKKIRLSGLHDVKKMLRDSCVHTVCEEARCPNITECFLKNTATFMIMGDVCTRACRFCNVKTGNTKPLDEDEATRVARTCTLMGLRHVVLTSVTRDDLDDGGASHFAKVISTIKNLNPGVSIEVLVPDFKADTASIDIVLDAGPDVFNHNMETVEELSDTIRPDAGYKRSLSVLSHASSASSKGALVKSGFMLGLGEKDEQIKNTMKDIKQAGTDILTIGQYFRPRKDLWPVKKIYENAYFEELRAYGSELGFKYVFSAPYVRSSYMAEEVFNK